MAVLTRVRRHWLQPGLSSAARVCPEMLAFRGIVVSHETLRHRGRKFGQAFADGVRRRLPQAGDKNAR